MSEPEPVTIHALELADDGDLWVEYEPDAWRFYTDQETPMTTDAMRYEAGPTRPVRIVTTDPDDAEIGGPLLPRVRAEPVEPLPAGLSVDQHTCECYTHDDQGADDAG